MEAAPAGVIRPRRGLTPAYYVQGAPIKDIKPFLQDVPHVTFLVRMGIIPTLVSLSNLLMQQTDRLL